MSIYSTLLNFITRRIQYLICDHFGAEMSSKEVYNVLKELNMCVVCTLRHLNVRCNEFDDIQQAYKHVCNIAK